MQDVEIPPLQLLLAILPFLLLLSRLASAS